jgi:hypothetical protein
MNQHGNFYWEQSPGATRPRIHGGGIWSRISAAIRNIRELPLDFGLATC